MTGIVLAHGKAQDVFDLHVSNWISMFNEICVICPADDPVEYSGLVYKIGLSEHHGYWNSERTRRACELAATYDSACILEYDTLVYNLPTPDNTLRGCGPMYDNKPNFISAWFMHSPWILSQDNFKKVSKYDVIDGRHEYSDRWISEACVTLDIKPSGLETFYTPRCGNIRNSDEWKDSVVAAHSKNLSAIHGIKEEILSRTISAIRKI
jgi:hypothetical protein